MEIIPVPNEDFFSQKFPEPAYPAPPMPECKPPKPTAEEMLKRALEFVKDGIKHNSDYMAYEDGFVEGKYKAYDDVADYLEMIIKEVKQNG